MNVLLVIILVIVGAFFVWQFALLIRDIVRKVKAKKNKSIDKDNSADNSAKKGE